MRAALLLTTVALFALQPLPILILPGLAATVPAAEVPTPGWPHTMTGKEGSLTVYPPQVTDWPERTKLEARMAVSVQRNGSATPIIGTLEISGQTAVDQIGRIVTISAFRLTSSHFPSLDTTQAGELAQRIQEALDTMPPKTVPLDMVLLSLQKAQLDARAVAVKNDPPAIYYSASPASLMVFDGEPVMVPIQGSPLLHAVNTNWPVFQDRDSHTWYLLITAPGSRHRARRGRGHQPAHCHRRSRRWRRTLTFRN